MLRNKNTHLKRRTCAFEFCVVLVGALVAVLDAITELGDFEELQDVDRGIHLQGDSFTNAFIDSLIHQSSFLH